MFMHAIPFKVLKYDHFYVLIKDITIKKKKLAFTKILIKDDKKYCVPIKTNFLKTLFNFFFKKKSCYN